MTMQQPHTKRRFVDVLWVSAPRRAFRRSILLGVVLADGSYLGAWPRIAPAVLPAAALLGFAVGAAHPDDLYTYSLLLTSLLAVVSTFGASIGLCALIGFVLGDLIFARLGESSRLTLTPDLDGLRALAALTISYLILAGLLALVPAAASAARIGVANWLVRWKQGSVVASATLVVAEVGLAFLWTQSTPFLIRPVWSYFSASPEVSGIEPLQQRGWVLALAVAVAAVGRLLLERASGWSALRDGWPVEEVSARAIPWWLAVIGRSVLVTAMLSGLVESPLGAVVVFLAVVGISFLHVRVLPGLTRYVKTVRRVPLLVRCLIVVVLAYALGTLIVEGARDRGSDSFVSVILATLISLVVVAALLPERPRDRTRTARGA
jgi:hypothetical protein